MKGSQQRRKYFVSCPFRCYIASILYKTLSCPLPDSHSSSMQIQYISALDMGWIWITAPRPSGRRKKVWKKKKRWFVILKMLHFMITESCRHMDIPSDTVGQNFSSNSISSGDRILLAILTLLWSARDWIIMNRKTNTTEIAAKPNNWGFFVDFVCYRVCVCLVLVFFLLYILNIASSFQNNWSIMSLNVLGDFSYLYGDPVSWSSHQDRFGTQTVSQLPGSVVRRYPGRLGVQGCDYNHLTAMTWWIGLEDYCPQFTG